MKALSKCLDVDLAALENTFGDHFFPDRAKLVDLPPRDPVIYRLYEIVQVHPIPPLKSTNAHLSLAHAPPFLVRQVQ